MYSIYYDYNEYSFVFLYVLHHIDNEKEIVKFAILAFLFPFRFRIEIVLFVLFGRLSVIKGMIFKNTTEKKYFNRGINYENLLKTNKIKKEKNMI